MVGASKIFESGVISNIAKMGVKTNKIIPASKAKYNDKKIQVIGGDSEDFQQETPPSIIIEKNEERIARIIVKCPCGRHSELICEYDDVTDDTDDTIHEIPKQSEVQDV